MSELLLKGRQRPLRKTTSAETNLVCPTDFADTGLLRRESSMEPKRAWIFLEWELELFVSRVYPAIEFLLQEIGGGVGDYY